MDLFKIAADLAAIETNISLDEEANLRARVEALDLLDFLAQIVRLRGRQEDLRALGQRVAAQRRRLERVNQHLFEKARAWVRSGRYTSQELRSWLGQYTDYAPQQAGQLHTGYDALDVLIDGLLGFTQAPEATREQSPEMVHLEPTPARAILDMVDRLHLTKDDVFYDLGSGLGQVVILVRLLTGVRAVGIEVEPSYCEVARDRAWVLGLSGVTFVNEDARQADYAEGTVFYLFTPFMGNMLQAVLDRLCTEARKRPLRVCTYGPCTPHVARQPWLRSADANADHEFKLAIFRSV